MLRGSPNPYVHTTDYRCHNDACPVNVQMQKEIALGETLGLMIRWAWLALKLAVFVGFVALVARWATS